MLNLLSTQMNDLWVIEGTINTLIIVCQNKPLQVIKNAIKENTHDQLNEVNSNTLNERILIQMLRGINE